MTLRTDLSNAASLSEALDNVTAALLITSNPNLVQTLELSAPGSAGVRVKVNIAAATLTTMLTARQTAIQTALTALGVT
jgi:alanine-alpha-ketoisovalerate/valine-pyruvate aminotransferase